MHLVINRGTLNGAGNALTLVSSYNGGVTWVQQLTISGTNEFSTGDGEMQTSNVLWFCYLSSTGSVLLRVFQYSLQTGAWSVNTSETILVDAAYTFVNPSLAIDAAG